ncbi:MAG: hypothetical protein Q9184_006926, partial [Pyrenodesmia sp. 2 TL-2023]
MLPPLWMLQGLQKSKCRKVRLAAIFSLALIDVIFDITRTIYTVDGDAVALHTDLGHLRVNSRSRYFCLAYLQSAVAGAEEE